MSNTTFADIMITQLNNPECSFLSGALIGNMFMFRFFIAIFVFYIVYKALDKLAITPLFDWLKDKLYKRDEK